MVVPHSGQLTAEMFAERFRGSSRVLWCIAAAVLGERAQAEDVVQEAAITALGKLDSFEPGSNFSAWMGRIVRFTALNHRRKVQRRGRREVYDFDVDSAAGRAGGPTLAFDRRTLAALNSLSEVARMCLLLKIVIELDYTEIATVLEIPPGTAMSHVHRARKKLRSLLAEEPARRRQQG